jgi:AhpD family alkylhydroperoxidase
MQARMKNPVFLNQDAMNALQALGAACHKSGGLPEAIHGLVHLRASQINGCAFCLDMHVKEAKIHGEKELRLYHLPIWRESSLFDARERAALEWAEAVTKLGEHGVPDAVYARVREHFDDKVIAGLTYAVGVINLWNRLSISFHNVPGSKDAQFKLDRANLSA